jgi:putative ABC transport system substrate-binding protein
MRRRHFIALFGTAAIWPFTARAEQTVRITRIGFLGFAPASAWAVQIQALRAGLRDLGYVEGTNFVFEFRWGEGVAQLQELAEDLVRTDVDVIFAPASTEVEPALHATKTIPIVFAQHADPVGIGHVVSLAHPGGNVTGVSMLLTEIAGKELELLKELLPDATRFGIIWNPTTPSHAHVLDALQSSATKLGVGLLLITAQTVEDFGGVFSTMAGEHLAGFLVLASPLANSHRQPLADLGLRYRLPGIFANKENVVAGGLMSYGADFNYKYRHAAIYIDKILKGEKPANLPVEQASKYEFIVNLKTAKELDLTIPQSLLARADEVIE